MDSRLSFHYSDNDLKINFDSEGVTTDEVMDHFIRFLLGIGYQRSSIHLAMQTIVDEHEDYLKNQDGRREELPSDLD